MTAGLDAPEGKLLADCRRLLADYAERYADQPDEQYHRLALLALEREQLVSFAYRENVLGRRLDRCQGPAEVLELLRYALLQVWRDEEAHTVFIRGELVRGDRRTLTLKALSEQAAGLLAGWSSAIKHHVPRTAAPLRSVLVDGLAIGARVVGKLSPDLRSELSYKTFRQFCLYNVDAEETAELCWQRLIELDGHLERGNRAAFERIADEEDIHRQVFALIADVLDDDDRVRLESTASVVAERLALIDERLVAPSWRRVHGRGSPTSLGAGGRVEVIAAPPGTAPGPEPKRAALTELLQRADLDVRGRTVAIKASWMLGYARRDPSTITDPALLIALVDELRAAGAADVVALDGPNVYSDLYANRAVPAVAAYFGLDRLSADVADAGLDTVPLAKPSVFGPRRISRRWVEADVRISITRLRSHPTEHAHLTTANLEGLIEDSCRNVFWNRSYAYSAASIAVGVDAPPTYAIIDAWDDCPDGWFGIMAGPQPKHPQRLYGGADGLAVDLVALRHTGSAEAIDSPTLRRAIEWFGDPRPTTTIVGPDVPISGWRNPYGNALQGLLADLSYPVYSWLSRRGAVFSPPMDPAFPEHRTLPIPLRAVRRLSHRLLGLRPPSTGRGR